MMKRTGEKIKGGINQAGLHAFRQRTKSRSVLMSETSFLSGPGQKQEEQKMPVGKKDKPNVKNGEECTGDIF